MTDQTWPFTPGDVVRDSGEDGDDGAWVEAAPAGTVLVDADGDEWEMRADGALVLDDAYVVPGREVAAMYGPMVVVSVGSDAR